LNTMRECEMIIQMVAGDSLASVDIHARPLV
jgi:hypothetical protein